MLKPEGDEERNVNHMFCNVNKSWFKAIKQTAAGNQSGRVAGKVPNISTRSERHFQGFFFSFLYCMWKFFGAPQRGFRQPPPQPKKEKKNPPQC